MVYINVIFLYLKNFYGSKLMVAIFKNQNFSNL